MIELKPHAQGVVLPLRVRPGARRNELVEIHNGALRLSVTAPPEDGKANDAVIELLAHDLNIHKSQIQLLTGQTSRQKQMLVTGITADDLRNRIEGVLETTLFEPPDSNP